MKTKLMFMAGAAALLAGCAQNEVMDIPESRAIGFTSYVGNTTRAEATDATEDYLKSNNGFYVFGGYLSGQESNTYEPVFDGSSSQANVKWLQGSWGYSPLNYWQDGATYKFAAYAPVSLQANESANKDIFEFDYTKNQLKTKNDKTFTADGKTDLLVAETKVEGYTVNYEEKASPELVKFKFFHALSKVRFTFVNGWRNEVRLTIKDVKLEGVKNSGKLTTTGTLATAVDKLPENSWTSQSGNATYAATDKMEENTKYGATYVFENFLLPQLLTDNVNLKLYFTAQVLNAQGSGPNLGNGAGKPVTKVVTIPSDVVTAWKPGNAYNYKLTISGATFDLKPIQFDGIEVDENWGNGGEDSIEDDEIEAEGNE